MLGRRNLFFVVLHGLNHLGVALQVLNEQYIGAVDVHPVFRPMELIAELDEVDALLALIRIGRGFVGLQVINISQLDFIPALALDGAKIDLAIG